ncbi:MAG: flavin reductase family protein [Gemmatimonadota bacterium]
MTDETMDAAEFRRVMGHFPSGIAVVTSSLSDGDPCGLTVNAFTSVSLVPPLILICVDRYAESRGCILRAGSFVVNVLEETDGERLARRFAGPHSEDKFRGVAYRSSASGVPILDRTLAWLECDVERTVEAGDHTIIIGKVVEADAREGHPLVYYRGGYGRFDR